MQCYHCNSGCYHGNSGCYHGNPGNSSCWECHHLTTSCLHLWSFPGCINYNTACSHLCVDVTWPRQFKKAGSLISSPFQGLQQNGLRPLSDPRFESTMNKIRSFANTEDATTIPEIMNLDDFRRYDHHSVVPLYLGHFYHYSWFGWCYIGASK